MSPPGLADLWAAVGALLAVPPGARRGVMAELIAGAEVASAFRRRWGRAHPLHGNGTLMAAALARPRAPRPADDPEALAALALAAGAVRRHLKRGAVKRAEQDYLGGS